MEFRPQCITIRMHPHYCRQSKLFYKIWNEFFSFKLDPMSFTLIPTSGLLMGALNRTIGSNCWVGFNARPSGYFKEVLDWHYNLYFASLLGASQYHPFSSINKCYSCVREGSGINAYFFRGTARTYIKQECIPVGCEPPALDRTETPAFQLDAYCSPFTVQGVSVREIPQTETPSSCGQNDIRK